MSEPKTADEIQARAIQLRRKFFPTVTKTVSIIKPRKQEKVPEPNFRVAYDRPIGPELPLLSFKSVAVLGVMYGETSPLIVLRIIAEEANRFGYTPADILSPRREYALVFTRHLSIWRSKKETSWSLPRIGKAFGNKDHTSIMHAIRRIDALHRTGELENAIASVILYKRRKDYEDERRLVFKGPRIPGYLREP